MSDQERLQNMIDYFRTAIPEEGLEQATERARAYIEQSDAYAASVVTKAGGSPVVTIGRCTQRGSHGRNSIAERFGR